MQPRMHASAEKAEKRNRARRLRLPAVAGRFYPADPALLARVVGGLLDAARARNAGGAVPAPVRAAIAPHAGYPCSGTVAAASFAALGAAWQRPGAPLTVYLVGPAHWHAVNGAGLSTAEAFATPLGEVPVALDRVDALLAAGAPFSAADGAHAPEHCLEVELPFLQVALPPFAIVPILVDEEVRPGDLAAALGDALAADPLSLLVVSSDLSHYRTYTEACALDRALLAALVEARPTGAARGEACGLLAILALMKIARRLGWAARVLDYRNSGDTCGDKQRVVGYGAVTFGPPRQTPPGAG